LHFGYFDLENCTGNGSRFAACYKFADLENNLQQICQRSVPEHYIFVWEVSNWSAIKLFVQIEQTCVTCDKIFFCAAGLEDDSDRTYDIYTTITLQSLSI